ncbi:alpha/beta hydrolase [Cellulomonas hominis]
MKGYWTDQQPGAGDTDLVEGLAVALRTCTGTLDSAATDVDRCAATITGGWQGQSATAWATQASARAGDLRATTEPCRAAANALAGYAATVRDIAARARTTSQDLETARSDVRRITNRSLWTTPDSETTGLHNLMARRALHQATEDLTDAQAHLARLADERRSADSLLVRLLADLTPPDWSAYQGLLTGFTTASLSGAPGWRAAFSRWVDGLPRTEAGAAALRWALAQLDDERFAELLAAEPAIALLLMRPADLTADPRFGAVARAATGVGGTDQVAAVAAAFATMTAADQATLARLHPWLVGNLDGAPFDLRITANRTAIAAALTQARADRFALEERLAALRQFDRPTTWPPDRSLQPDTVLGLIGDLDVNAEQIARYQRLLTETIDVFDGDEVTTMTGHQVVLFDPAGGRFAELVGTLASHTTNIGVLVGGTGTNMPTMKGQYDRAWAFVANAKPGGSLAMITYLGGPMPQEIAPDAVDSAYALDIAPRLRDFVAGLDNPTGAAVTVMGHSYGGSVVGAAEHVGMTADRILHVESAGAGPGVSDAADYAAPGTPRYSMTAPGDLIELAQGANMLGVGHGADPDLLDGVVRLETGRTDHEDPASALLEGPASHSGVFAPGSTAWENMSNVLTGQDVMVYTDPTPHIYPRPYGGATVTFEYPMEDPEFTPPTVPVP